MSNNMTKQKVKSVIDDSDEVQEITAARTPMKITRSSESDGRSNVTDCFDLQFVFIALIGLYFLDCPDWFIFP